MHPQLRRGTRTGFECTQTANGTAPHGFCRKRVLQQTAAPVRGSADAGFWCEERIQSNIPAILRQQIRQMEERGYIAIINGVLASPSTIISCCNLSYVLHVCSRPSRHPSKHRSQSSMWSSNWSHRSSADPFRRETSSSVGTNAAMAMGLAVFLPHRYSCDFT